MARFYTSHTPARPGLLHSSTLLASVAHLLCIPLANAQLPTPTQTVESITVEGKAAPVLEPERTQVGGFADVSVRNLAQSVTVLSKDLVSETALGSLSQLTRLDASLSDAYNTTGYNQTASLRGFTLDNLYNFRRDGLPMLNVGPLALENKAQVEILKGVSGMLAGVSAPGGLVNLTTFRPSKDFTRSATASVGERGSAGVAATIGGQSDGTGFRLDASAHALRPMVDNARGERQFASGAFDGRITPATTISLDLEAQRFSQPSVPAVSPLDKNGDGIGDYLPTAQPRHNINAQPWTQPFQTVSTLAALKLSHTISPAWRVHAAAQTQRVRTNDRIAFPDGCSNSATYVYPGFCGNGDFDLYDFRSDNERRTLSVLDLHARHNAILGGARTTLTLGAMQRDFSQRTQAQAYNYVGSGNIFSGTPALPAAPELAVAGTDLDERNAELYAHAHVTFADAAHFFAGLRSARVSRGSVRTDGSEAVEIAQRVVTPWLGASWTVVPTLNVYASWGQGAESEFVPNRPAQYVNYGAALPVLKSTQFEIGAKWQAARRLLLTASAFEIVKPYGDDVMNGAGLATRVAGAKEARHRGIEFAAIGRVTPQLSIQTSAALLDAKFTRATNAELIGSRVTNVPRVAATLFVDYQFEVVKGFALNALLSAQGKKAVTPDLTLTLPAQAQLDVGARYAHVGSGQRVTWRLNVENLTNRTGWREAPTQPWGGIYLLPTPARAVRASVGVEW